MKVKPTNKFLRFFLAKNVQGITLAPFGIYLDDKVYKDSVTITHEKIHWKQQMELLILPFYIIYLLEWLLKMITYGKKAYRNISFEREAYDNQHSAYYPYGRKHFSWIKRI